ncbi:MAG: hypothetical protein RRC34_14360 [Lentisphaeria bacterium]|nr:hypothetical protein [Lentisphaeria bacterium]
MTSHPIFTSVSPAFERNYRLGHIGFTYRSDSLISHGIAYFTRWTRLSDIPVSHVLIVTGADTCVEAVKGVGVVETPLQRYFDNETIRISFREPVRLTSELGRRIADTATSQVGADYDISLILAQALDGSFLGRLLHRFFGEDHHLKVSDWLNHPDRWICSELAAYALDTQPEFHDRGILAKPDAAIEPQELFEDTVLFKPWK